MHANLTSPILSAPTATFFGGVNGAGKTTFYYNALERGESFGHRINVDEIVSAIGSYRNPTDQIRAGKIALILRNACITQRQDFNQESTLCSRGIFRLFRHLRANNYRIHLIFIRLDSIQTAIERVKIRTDKGGHSVDSALIESRFYKSQAHFAKLLPYCHSAQIFDNSTFDIHARSFTRLPLSAI